jgi:hypothetical protein
VAEPFGIVLAAASVAVANEILFDPAAHGDTPSIADFNWRIVPATLILGAMLSGMGKVSPPFAKGLAGMTMLAVLLTHTSAEKSSPLENLATMVNAPSGKRLRGGIRPVKGRKT